LYGDCMKKRLIAILGKSCARLKYVGGKVVAVAGGTNASVISLTDLTGGVASSPSANDIVIICVAIGGSNQPIISAINTTGYTGNTKIWGNGSNYDAAQRVFWKVMSGTPDTSVSIDMSGDLQFAQAIAIQVWRGADVDVPFDVTDISATGSGGANPNPASITPVTDGSQILVFGSGASSNANTTPYTASDLSNFNTIFSSNINSAVIGSGSYAWSSGAFDPAAWTGASTGSGASWTAYTLALKPELVSPIQYVGGYSASFVGSTSPDNSVSLTALTGGLASSPSANDLVLVFYSTGSEVDRAIGVTTTGYTEEQELYSNGASYDTNLSVSWKVMGGTPDTTVSVSPTGSNNDAGCVIIQVWRGVDTTTPFDVAETTATGVGNTTFNPPAITPTSQSSYIVIVGACGAGKTISITTPTDLIKFIKITNSASSCNAGLGVGVYILVRKNYFAIYTLSSFSCS